MYDAESNNETLKYISDWQNRAKKQQKKYNILLLIAVVVTFSVCTLFFVLYSNENYNRIVVLNRNYVQDSAIQEANQVELKLDDMIKVIVKYSKQYVVLDDRAPHLTIEDKLNMLCDRTLFDRIAFIDADGIDISLEGVTDVSDRAYFQKAMNGQKGYEYLETSRITGKPTLIFYAPIYRDEKIVGVMAGFYERSRLDELLSYQFFNYTPNTYLLKGDGIVVANSADDYIAANMFDDLIAKNYIGDTDYELIQEVIGDTSRTSISFSFIDHGKTSVGVIAQFSNSDWMILSVLPYEVTESMIANANRVGRNLLTAVVATFIVLIIFFMYTLKMRYARLEDEMSVTTDNLKKTSKHDQLQAFIIESLGNTYSSVYYVNTRTASYSRIKEFETGVMTLPDKGDWHKNFGRYVESFVDPNYQKSFDRFKDIENFENNLNNNDNMSVEYQRVDKGWRKAYMIPVERGEDNRILSVIFAVQKIDVEKEAELETQKALQEAYEAAQLASMAKTTFLSNMSHDIRTPMNAIIGMTVIAAANINNTEKVSDCLKKITSSSKHLLGLINEVLDMSKIESGKVDLSDEEFSLPDLIDELISMNQSLIREKNHTLIVKVNQLTHEKVIGDSTRLQQVFTNLLTNAIKYTPEGGKLEIILTEKSTNKSTVGWYEVLFRDNGIGMSKEFQQNIFDPFSRADDTRISTIQGTGLGMAIARNIVRMMNGDLTVESEINKGSTFTVSFSLKLQNEEKCDYTHFTDLPVLVVDDDESACQSVCTILDSLTMHSEWVTSGREAIEKVSERHKKNDDYYAVILDWKMPDMDGVATAKEIRRQIGDEIPIIVLTAYDWNDIEQEAKSAGVNAFLSKPLFKSRLVNLFTDFIKRSEAELPKQDEIAQPDFTGRRILLAEDNELNREIAVEMLSMIGLEIETAENGKICKEMLEAAKPGYYDLIFMDVQMPVMNGYEATKAIRATEHPDAKKIPIIAMTANAFSTDVRAAFNSGMNGHISKPIDINVIISVLKENLKNKL